jgi:hypothetical protein
MPAVAIPSQIVRVPPQNYILGFAFGVGTTGEEVFIAPGKITGLRVSGGGAGGRPYL